MKFGFMNGPDVPRALQLCNKHQGLRLDDDPDDVTYFLSRLTAVPTPGQGMALWRERLLVMMSARASNAAEYFCLPDSSLIQPKTEERRGGEEGGHKVRTRGWPYRKQKKKTEQNHAQT